MLRDAAFSGKVIKKDFVDTDNSFSYSNQQAGWICVKAPEAIQDNPGEEFKESRMTEGEKVEKTSVDFVVFLFPSVN